MTIREVIYTRTHDDGSVTLERYLCEAKNNGDAVDRWKADCDGLKVCIIGVGECDE